MAGCVPCFIIPLLLFIFHRYIQPILLKYWNPWESKQLQTGPLGEQTKPKVQQNQTVEERKTSEEKKLQF